ncbi:MAG: ribonuclease P protein component [Sideroxydans sp.]
MCSTNRRSFFTRQSRLSRRDDFSSLLKQKPKSNQWFAVYSKQNKSGCTRLGLAVSKHLIPKAVQRNNIKRMIRECFRAINRDGIERDIVVKLRARLDKADQVTAYSLLAAILREIILKKQ